MLPLSKPIHGVDGTMLTEVPVTRGTPILAPALGCNTNKDLWGDDALEWKPERWLEKLPQALDDVRIPGIYSNLYGSSLAAERFARDTHAHTI